MKNKMYQMIQQIVRTQTCATVLLLALFITGSLQAATKTANTTGSWSNASIWSPSGVPASGDDVIINSGITVTVDGSYTCHDLDLGNATNSNTTLRIIAGGNSLTVSGDLDFNAQDKGSVYTIDAGPGAMSFTGTFSHWSNTGTNRFRIGTGSMSFTPAVSINDAGKSIEFTGGGAVTFNSNFSDDEDNMTFYTGCVVNFYGNYTVTGSDVDWNGKGTANFYGTGTITDNNDIIMNDVNLMSGATTTLAAGTQTFTVEGDFTINSSATFNMNDNFTLNGDFTNNGTISAGSVTITFDGTTQAINGSSSLSLPKLYIGKTNGNHDCTVTMNQSATCTDLIISKTRKNRSLSLSGGVTLTVNGDLTLYQPTRNNRYSNLTVGSGTCTVTGNLIFSGSNSGQTRLCKIDVSSGTFTLDGTITWMGNNAVSTETISCSSGTLNFNSSVTMGTKSGTISTNSTGKLYFNGTSAPSLNFGGSVSPVLGTAYGCTVKFAKGLTVNTNPLAFAVGSTAKFSGTGTITPSAAITFGHLTIDAGYTVTAAGNFYIKGNWTNNGTFAPGTYTVTFNGGGVQTLTRSGGETFYGLSGTPYGTTVNMNDDVTVTNKLTLNGGNFNANGNTMQLGNGSGADLDYSYGAVYGGTFKRYWPATAISSTTGNLYGYFPLGTITDQRPISINSTVSPTGAGYVSASHTDAFTVTNLTYTDNQGFQIQQIADRHSDLSYTSVTGGTYDLDVKMTDMGSQGNVADLRMLWYDAGSPGSAGTHVTTSGPLAAPTGHRTGLSLANLAHNWVLGTNNRSATPMYNYVYSRANGNWNDTSGTGPWSYTAGGSGAACHCYPGSSGYAVIETGHTITLTATDTAMFVDIDTGGALTINSGKTMKVSGSLTLYGTATFTNNGTLTVGNELVLSSSTSPTVNGDVTAQYFTMPSGTNYTQSSGTLHVTNELAMSGNITMATGTSFLFDGTYGHLSGTNGTFQGPSGGSFTMTNNKVIEPGTTITIGSSGTNTALAVASNSTINNIGEITVYGNITGASGTAYWLNNATSLLSGTGSIMSTGILDASTSPNTVEYAGSGAQTFTVPAFSYNVLKAANAGTKTLAGDIYVDSMLVIGGTVIVDESTNVISGDGGITMSGTSELKLSRSTDDNVYPELTGNYSLTGGTVTLYQTADSCQVRGAAYYNLKLNGSTPYDLGAVSTISNNLDMTNSSTIGDNGILNVGGAFTYASSGSSYLWDSIAVNGIALNSGTIHTQGESINVYGAGGWSKASGATFTPYTGTVYFSGNTAQILGGTSTSQTFNNLCVNKSSNTATVGGSTTTLNLTQDMILTAGAFDKGTASTINMLSGNWNNNGGSFTAGSGTVNFTCDTAGQAIQGTASSETFNNVTVDKTAQTLAIGQSITTVNLNGNMTLTDGTLNAGTATGINVKGNWTNAAAADFTPANSDVTFNGTGAQAINGTATSQLFYKLSVNKSSNTLSVAGSTDTLTATSDVTLTAGTFDKGTATNIYAGGNWTNNGGTFTYGTGTVHFNGTAAQAINGSATAQDFYNLTLNKASDTLSLGGSTGTVTINNTLTFTSGLIKTGSGKVSIPTTATVSGAGTSKYIYGNEEIYIPNTAAPSKTFHIGDASTYAPATLAFVGTVSGSGAITGSTAAGDDADIANSGLNSAKSVNRTWELSNSGVAGFTSYSPTYTFVAGDVDGGANTDSLVIRRLTGGTWYATTTGSRTSTTTQATGETSFGRTQIGEKQTITVSTHPGDLSKCTGYSATFTSTSSSTPTPTVKWQRDPNTGSWADITGVMDGSVYSNFTTTTLSVSDVTGLNAYKYRAVFTNVNGSATSNSATLTVSNAPSITGTTPGSRCDAGTVALGATSSAGTINWYAASSGGSSLGTGTGFTTPTIATTTSYYVDATDGGCTTASRTAVTATVTPTPTITGTTPAGTCGTGTVNLGATASAGTINWFAASSGGSSLGTGTGFTTPSISVNTTYYVDATDAGCTTGSRTSVLASVYTIPTASVAYQSCAGVNGETTIRVSGSGGSSPYNYKINSGSFSSEDTFHVANGSNHNYYTEDSHGCASTAVNFTATSVVPTQISSSVGSISCSCASAAEGRDVYLTDASNNLVAIINDKGHDLGTVSATAYKRASSVLINNNQGGQDAAMGRSFVLDFTGTGLTPAVEVKFPYTDAEMDSLKVSAAATPITTDDISTAADLGSTQYEGPSEDDTYNTASATYLVYHRQLSNGSVLNGKYVTIGLSQNGEHWLHGNNGNNSPLPVKLVSFTATANDAADKVETRWTTSLEINSDYFGVERSADGINFNEVGRVAAAGNNTGNIDYRFDDTKPFAGLSYYRLRQVDLDGSYEYSNIVSVTMGHQNYVQIYPNPTNSELNIDVANPSDKILLTVYNISGQEVFAKTFGSMAVNKTEHITLNIKNELAAGMYMVKVSTNGISFNSKLVIE